MGQQDPYVRVRIGEYTEKTYTKDNGGGDVLFDFLDLKVPVTREVLQSGRIEMEAWDENSKLDLRGDVLIGSSSCVLEGVTTMGETVELEFQLKDKKGKDSGRILAFLRLEDTPPPVEVELPVIGDSFKEGTVFVRRIVSFGLQNTEMFAVLGGGKQDPYVTLKVKDTVPPGGLEWEGSTPVLNNAGANNVWDFLDLKFDVTRNQLLSSSVDVMVKDKNITRGDALIGGGVIQLKKINALNQLLELPIDLKMTDKKGVVIEKSRGKLVCYVELKLKEQTDFVLQKGFKFGKLQITRIQTYNLKNTELGLGALQDPYCVLKLGEGWTDKTYTQENAGADVLWNFLSINCDINAEMVRNEKLEITVFDENTGRKDALIGSGSTSLMSCGAKIGEEKELSIAIVDEKEKPSGRVIVYAKIIESIEEDNIIIPDTFIDGILRIKRVTLSNTTVGKDFHLLKSEPYVILKLNKFNERTPVSTNKNESNVTWNNLDYAVNCDYKTVQSSELLVEVWTHSMTGDTLVSTAKVPVRASGGGIGKEVEISRELVIAGKEGKAAGRVTVACQLNPSEVKLKEKDLGNRIILNMLFDI